jgi:hypothetical protein
VEVGQGSDNAPDAMVSKVTEVRYMAKKEMKGKPRLELLKRKALEEMAFIRTFGIDKYANDVDWRLNPIEEYLGAALRHIYKHLDGEQNDEESGRLHLGHAMVDLMLAIELVRNPGAFDHTSDTLPYTMGAPIISGGGGSGYNIISINGKVIE